MPAVTLGQLIGAYGVDVLEHLDRDLEVPVYGGLQIQGDVAVIPLPEGSERGEAGTPVPPAGIPVIRASGGGHEHRLLAGTPGTAFWTPSGSGQDLGVLQAAEPAYLAHPEHGYLGIASGSYMLRRQREQAGADSQRLVED
jgi:hypothetical protein